MRIIFPLLPRDHAAIAFLHKALALDRKSHSISTSSHGFFHEVRGKAELVDATVVDIYSPVDIEWLKETLRSQDYSESDCEFISLITANDEEMITLKGWSISNGEQ